MPLQQDIMADENFQNGGTNIPMLEKKLNAEVVVKVEALIVETEPA